MSLSEDSKRPQLTDEEISKLSPQAQEFIAFCRDLTRNLKWAAEHDTRIGCSVDHGERPKSSTGHS